MRMFRMVMTTGHEYEITEDQVLIWRKSNSGTGKLRPFIPLRRGPSEELWINLEHVAIVEFTHEVEDKPVPKEPKPEPKKRDRSEVPNPSNVERAQKVMEEMYQKSACEHPNHDIYYVDARGPKPGSVSRKYFPVCADCGVRERYVKKDSLTEEQIENAKQWVDKS